MTIFRRLASLPLLIALAFLPWLPRSLRPHPHTGPLALSPARPAPSRRAARIALLDRSVSAGETADGATAAAPVSLEDAVHSGLAQEFTALHSASRA